MSRPAMTRAFLFPGQGSQKVGMAKDRSHHDQQERTKSEDREKVARPDINGSTWRAGEIAGARHRRARPAKQPSHDQHNQHAGEVQHHQQHEQHVVDAAPAVLNDDLLRRGSGGADAPVLRRVRRIDLAVLVGGGPGQRGRRDTQGVACYRARAAGLCTDGAASLRA